MFSASRLRPRGCPCLSDAVETLLRAPITTNSGPVLRSVAVSGPWYPNPALIAGQKHQRKACHLSGSGEGLQEGDAIKLSSTVRVLEREVARGEMACMLS